MSKSIKIIGRAITLWWDELFLMMLFNIIWLALQVPIITGPPATAAMFAIARHRIKGDYIDPRLGWNALRRMFLPSLKWGLAYLTVIGLIVFNFWSYREAAGLGWTIFRLLWGMIGVTWLIANFFYWPFWLNQSDQRISTTLRNSMVFIIRNLSLSLPLIVICSAFAIVSILTTLPLATVLMAWLALISTLAVEENLKELRNSSDLEEAQTEKTTL